jgi:hypothetical protein
MAQRRALVIGLDPTTIAGWDPEPVVAAIKQHAPGAAIAFNSSPEDFADAALRWLR